MPSSLEKCDWRHVFWLHCSMLPITLNMVAHRPVYMLPRSSGLAADMPDLPRLDLQVIPTSRQALVSVSVCAHACEHGSLLTPKFHQMRVWCISAPERQRSWYVSILVSKLSPTAAALCLYSVAAPMIRSPLQQIHKASVFIEWWSTTQQFSTEQIERDRNQTQIQR